MTVQNCLLFMQTSLISFPTNTKMLTCGIIYSTGDELPTLKIPTAILLVSRQLMKNHQTHWYVSGLCCIGVGL